MLKRWLALSGGWLAWSWALAVLAVTAALMILDASVGSVSGYWSRHSFSSSVLSGLLVLLLTVLIVDRVVRIRQLRNQSRAIAAQAAVVLAQAVRARDAITHASKPGAHSDEASGELRTYTLMLLISTPVLIDSTVPRTFLESAQRVALQLSRALRATGDEQASRAKARLDEGVRQLRRAADPLLQALSPNERAAASSDEADSGSDG